MTTEEIVARLKGVRRSGGGWVAFCPSHEDHERSLSIGTGEDGRTLLNCHAKKCTQEQIVAALGLTMKDLFAPSPNGHHVASRIVKTYDYVGGSGALLYQAVRLEPKSFFQRRPDGHGGWIHNLTGVRRVLYRLPDLVEQPRVVWCEGERDCDNLVAHGFIATTACGGVGGWRDEYAQQLADLGTRQLVISPDHDTPGLKYAATIARAATAAGLEVRVLQLPGQGPVLEKHGRDVSDWLAAGHTREELEALIATTAPELPWDEGEPPEPAATPTTDEPPTKVLRGAEIATVTLADTDWMIHRVFSTGRQHMVTGASQSAKTWLGFDVAIAVAHPEITTVLGQRVCRHGRVCIESWEMGQAEDVRRTMKLLRGHGLGAPSEDLILLSDTRPTLNEDSYFTRRRRELREWGVIFYLVDSLSEAAGIELNDNTAFTAWWRARIKPLLDDGVTVLWTHLRGHAKPGVAQDRDSASRGATQIRALSTGVLDIRQVSDVLFTLRHNKHRDGLALPFGALTLEGAVDDPAVRLVVRDEAAGLLGKQALARRLLTSLGQAQAATAGDPLTRTTIEKALNGRDRPKDERVSKKTYEPVLADLVTEGRFHRSRVGNADVWAWAGPAGEDGEDTDEE